MYSRGYNFRLYGSWAKLNNLKQFFHKTNILILLEGLRWPYFWAKGIIAMHVGPKSSAQRQGKALRYVATRRCRYRNPGLCRLPTDMRHALSFFKSKAFRPNLGDMNTREPKDKYVEINGLRLHYLEWKEIPKASHMPAQENPGAFIKILSDFLSK